MTQYGFYVDVSKCTGCKACVVACKDKNNLEVGRNFRHVLEYSGGHWRQDRMTGAWHQDVFAYYVPLSCNQCSAPACVKVCPTGAHAKRAKDGLVLIDAKKCIGCGLCARACPYEAPVLNEKTHKMTKCDACADRLDKGLRPICVESCPQRAIDFGPVETLREKYGSDKHFAPLPDPTVTRPNLVVRAPAAAKPINDQTGTVRK